MNTFAQRHYKNISALEMNYGSNIFGDYGHYGNLSFSKYVNRKSYWKAGISYFEKPYDYAIPKKTVPSYASGHTSCSCTYTECTGSSGNACTGRNRMGKIKRHGTFIWTEAIIIRLSPTSDPSIGT